MGLSTVSSDPHGQYECADSQKPLDKCPMVYLLWLQVLSVLGSSPASQLWAHPSSLSACAVCHCLSLLKTLQGWVLPLLCLTVPILNLIFLRVHICVWAGLTQEEPKAGPYSG